MPQDVCCVHRAEIARFSCYEKWERAQDAIEASGLLERFLDKDQAYYCEAFLDDELTWYETVYGQDELQEFKDDAIKAGFTYTVQLVDDD